ncbi:MAG TPA: MATE family efflux transporter [Candidatus Limiplasma sp.]|nr:MATE family efflux transporter [Candidatus Limiplasma sp.]HRX08819.1 MATE family efflux transporter [Candidatus Limiplasma sp.]
MSNEASCGKSKYEVDMTQGSITRHLVRFSITVALTGVLQLLYNTVDTIVVGQFAGKEALAAVGSTGSLINLLITMFVGLSVGASIVLAKYYGEGNLKAVSDTAHTAIAVAAIAGLIMAVVGFVLARPILLAMGVPDDVLDQATLYMQLYFVGIPFSFINVFGSAVLRAVGDTRRPLYILTLSGLLNVALNLLFVIVFHMGVAGVAWGTVLSNVLSAYLILRVLTHTEGAIRIILKKLRIKASVLIPITRIGLPAGLEGAMFGISNVLIQSAINSFGSLVVAGNAISVNLMGLVYVVMQSITQAGMTFTSQNMGAQQYRRVRMSPLITMVLVSIAAGAMSNLMAAYAMPLASLYNDNPDVLYYAALRMGITFPLYFIFGIMQTFASQLRGMGHGMLPMVVSISGISGIRIGWMYTAFAANRTLETLYIGYPISWAATMAILIVCYIVVLRKVPKDDLQPPECAIP